MGGRNVDRALFIVEPPEDIHASEAFHRSPVLIIVGGAVDQVFIR
jgi:hypothetical protein